MKIVIASFALLASIASAEAAQTTVSIVINSPPSTTVTCTPVALTAPVAAGTVVCPITVAPSGWSGALALSGPDASAFSLSGSNLVIGSSANAGTAGNYNVTITTNP